MIIPKYLTLEPRQIEKLNKWADGLKKPTIKQLEEMYGGFTITSRFLFELQETGLCTEINVTDEFTGLNCDLTIDDNNELAE